MADVSGGEVGASETRERGECTASALVNEVARWKERKEAEQTWSMIKLRALPRAFFAWMVYRSTACVWSVCVSIWASREGRVEQSQCQHSLTPCDVARSEERDGYAEAT